MEKKALPRSEIIENIQRAADIDFDVCTEWLMKVRLTCRLDP